ncbi:MAG: ComEC/Rec2 family competence protein [Clostridia bacterium]|nr:ComEC/Rec2 family competence protein [Clostridia bacterium]
MKLINHRPLLFVALSLIVGIVTAYTLLYGQWWLLTSVVTLVLVAIIYTAITRRKNMTWLIFALCLFVFMGFGLFQIELGKADLRSVGKVYCNFSGTLTDDVYQNGNYYLVVLRDFSCDVDGAELKVQGKVQLVLWLDNFVDENGKSYLDLSCGNKIEGQGVLSDNYLFKDGVNGFSYRDQIYYKLENATNVATIQGRANFGERARSYLKNQFERYMPNNSGLAYALLVGDKSLADQQILDAFKDTGIIHLLAVSGLHVGFIVTILAFVLKGLKVPVWLNFVITTSILLLYGTICSFTPSVSRAIVMTVCVFLCTFTLRKVDLLSSLSLAVIVILTLRPLYLFDGGFLMSVSSVFGIATFTAQATRLYSSKIKNKAIKWLVNALFASCGATLGTVGWVAKFYGAVPLVGLVFNVVAVPFIGFCFNLIALGTIPFLSFILAVADWLLSAISFVTIFLSNTPSLVFCISLFAIISILIWLFIFGGFVNIRVNKRRILLVSLALLIVASCTISTLFSQKINRNSQIHVLDTNGSGAFIVEQKQDFFVVCDFDGYNDDVLLCNHLDGFKDFNLDVVICDLTSVKEKVLNQFLQQYIPNSVYVLGNQRDDQIVDVFVGKGIDVIFVPQTSGLDFGDLKISGVFDGVLVGVSIELKNTRFLAIKTDSTYLAESVVQQNLFDVVYTQVGAKEIAQTNPQLTIFTNQHEKADNIYCANRVGEWTLVVKSDKIIIKL